MKLTRFVLVTAAATAIAGTLDLVAAMLIARSNDSGLIRMLQHIASGIFGDRASTALLYALIGLALHYAIVFCMAGAYMLAAPKVKMARSRPLVIGAGYGLILWAVMDLIVVPLRWPGTLTLVDPLAVLEQIFCHVVLVGMPIALVYASLAQPPARTVKRRRSAATPARAPRR